ncbi:MAG: SGNH/GDSL hydrolase family protein [Ginsengibacter sp.]
MKCTYFFLVIIFSWNISFGQVPLFKDGDTVCFVGNSITMNGRFHNYIELFYATRFPERAIQFFNCGISGDKTSDVLKRINTDVLIHHPTVCVVMLGMNDVGSSLYKKERQNEAGIKDKQERALTDYFRMVDSIVNIFLQSNIKVVLQTPSIYDQTAKIKLESEVGTNDALGRCTVFLKQLAKKYDLPIVDYWTILNKVTNKVQQKNSASTIIGGDRVHPGNYGHFVMATEFLKAQHVPGLVSWITINTKKSTVKKVQGATVTDLLNSNGTVSFQSIESALPYPRITEDFVQDSLVDFTGQLNREILKFISLTKGKYLLQIDEDTAGIFSSVALKNGINLSNNTATPQYKQSKKVLDTFYLYWGLIHELRTIKFIEYKLLGGYKSAYKDLDEIKQLFEANLKKHKDEPQDYINYYKEQFGDYLTIKPKEGDIEKETARLLTEIRKLNLPVKHLYRLGKVQ